MGSAKIEMCAGCIRNIERSLNISGERKYMSKGKDVPNRMMVQKNLHVLVPPGILVGRRRVAGDEVYRLNPVPYAGHWIR